ncbi:hypothetical protein JCM19000A_33880 [Silvimonas sp. JCM 19000]
MTTLKTLRDDILHNCNDLVRVMRQCHRLAVESNVKQVRDWLELELSGYPLNKALPSYRVVQVQSYAQLRGNHIQVSRVMVPAEFVPEELRDGVNKAQLRNGIADYLPLLHGRRDDELQDIWPQHHLRKLDDGQPFAAGMRCVAAWRSMNRHAIHDLVNAIRARLLRALTEIEIHSRALAADARPGRLGATVRQPDFAHLASANSAQPAAVFARQGRAVA